MFVTGEGLRRGPVRAVIAELHGVDAILVGCPEGKGYILIVDYRGAVKGRLPNSSRVLALGVAVKAT